MTFKDSGSHQNSAVNVTNFALHTVPVDSTGALIGVNNGGIKVYSVSDPSRDVFNSWFFGSDTATEALTANTLANGLWLDQSLLHPSARSIVIINGNAAPDYAYTIEYSRNALGVAGSDTYTVTSVAAGAKAQIVQVAFPAGYDKFVRLTITPTTGQAGTQLNFKAYLAGRGG